MGWISSAWKSTKNAVSSGWDSVKDTVKDVTGVDSMNSLAILPGVSTTLAALGGKGVLGEAVSGAMAPLLQPPGGQPQQGGALSGPLTQAAPQMSMGTGAPAPAQSVAPSASDVASLFGQSGYQAGDPSSVSAALLAQNPDAYQFSPLAQSLV